MLHRTETEPNTSSMAHAPNKETCFQNLILKLQGSSTSTFKIANGALNIQRIAKPVIGIHDDRRFNTVGYGGKRVMDLGHANQPDIRPAKTRIGKACP